MDNLTDTISSFHSLIDRHRFDLSDEKRLQIQIEEVLTKARISFQREHTLSPGDIVDFMLLNGVAVECKLRGHQKKAVYRQLKRYAEHTETRALVLVTNISMGLPDIIEGKPAYYISLSRGWL